MGPLSRGRPSLRFSFTLLLNISDEFFHQVKDGEPTLFQRFDDTFVPALRRNLGLTALSTEVEPEINYLEMTPTVFYARERRMPAC